MAVQSPNRWQRAGPHPQSASYLHQCHLLPSHPQPVAGSAFLTDVKIFIASVDDRQVWRHAVANVAAEPIRTNLSHDSPKDLPMASTPSKDHKRREREQKKLDKRFAREDAKAEKLEAQQLADQAAAEEAAKMSEAEIQAKIEADFEAELEAEAAAERAFQVAC